MNKKEILKHYGSSLKKWKSFLSDIQLERNLPYRELYWQPCGFCDVAYGMCSKCPLYKRRHEGIRYCNNDPDPITTAYRIIRLVGGLANFKEAERLCIQFIKIIKQEIKKIKDV